MNNLMRIRWKTGLKLINQMAGGIIIFLRLEGGRKIKIRGEGGIISFNFLSWSAGNLINKRRLSGQKFFLEPHSSINFFEMTKMLKNFFRN